MPQELINSYLGCCTLPCRDNKLIGSAVITRQNTLAHTAAHHEVPHGDLGLRRDRRDHPRCRWHHTHTDRAWHC